MELTAKELAKKAKYQEKLHSYQKYVCNYLRHNSVIRGDEPNNVVKKIMKSKLELKDKAELLTLTYHRYFSKVLDRHVGTDIIEDHGTYDFIFSLKDEHGKPKKDVEKYNYIFDSVRSAFASIALDNYTAAVEDLCSKGEMDPYTDLNAATCDCMKKAKAYTDHCVGRTIDQNREALNDTLSYFSNYSFEEMLSGVPAKAKNDTMELFA